MHLHEQPPTTGGPERQAQPLSHRIPKAAALAGVSPRTLYNEIKANRLRSVRVGGTDKRAGVRLIRHEDLLAWLELGLEEPKSA